MTHSPADTLLEAAENRPGTADEPEADQEHQRDRQECHDRQLPIESDQDDDAPQKEDDRVDQLDQPSAGKLADLLDVAGYSGQQLSGLDRVVEAKALPLDVSEKRVAEFVGQPLRGALGAVGLGEACNPTDDRDRDQPERREEDYSTVPSANPGIDSQSNKLRTSERCQGDKQEPAERQKRPRPRRPQESQRTR